MRAEHKRGDALKRQFAITREEACIRPEALAGHTTVQLATTAPNDTNLDLPMTTSLVVLMGY